MMRIHIPLSRFAANTIFSRPNLATGAPVIEPNVRPMPDTPGKPTKAPDRIPEPPPLLEPCRRERPEKEPVPCDAPDACFR